MGIAGKPLSAAEIITDNFIQFEANGIKIRTPVAPVGGIDGGFIVLYILNHIIKDKLMPGCRISSVACICCPAQQLPVAGIGNAEIVMTVFIFQRVDVVGFAFVGHALIVASGVCSA